MECKQYTIYKICCKDPNIKDFYIGSTSSYVRRIQAHKTAVFNPSNTAHNYPVYKVIRECGGWDNWEHSIIEEIKNTTKTEARIREEQLTKELGATLNTWKAHRTPNETKTYYSNGSVWYVLNKERAKKRYRDNCDKLLRLEKENAELKLKIKELLCES